MPPSFLGNNPLANDDPTLNNPADTEFSTSPGGLDLRSMSRLEALGRRAELRGMQGMPGVPGMPATDNGSAAMLAQLGEIANRPLLPPASPSTQPQIYFSPSTGEMVVNGFLFNQRNASAALASEEHFNQPRQQFTLPDTATDWRTVSQPEYQAYIDSIRNPTYGERIGEAWEHAWRGVGDVALGASLAVNDDWEWAQTARQNIAREYEENAPFMLRLRDVENVGDGLTYASQMLVQAVPWIIETIASMAVGAAIGGIVSGGVGAPVGAVEGFIAKEALRRGTMTMLQQNLRRGATAYSQSLARRPGSASLPREIVIRDAVASGTASADDVNRFYNFGERAFHLTRGARDASVDISSMLRSVGGVAGGFASNYATAVGDIRNSIADAGGDPTSAEALGQIWGMGIPYAAITSVLDLIVTQPITNIFPGMLSGPFRVGNAARGVATGFAAEATQETAQYVITQNAAAQVTDTPISLEPIDLLEVAVGGGLAGAGVGGLLGALGRPTPRYAGLLPPPATALGPSPTGTPAPSAPPSDPRTQLSRMSDTLAGIRQQEGGAAYTGAALDALRNVPPSQNRTEEERETLSTTLLDPNLTPEQRAATIEAIEALQGGRTVDEEAAQRGAARQSRGVTPMDPIAPPQPYITDEEIAGLRESDAELRDLQAQPPRAMTERDVSLPPNLSRIGPRLGGTRNPMAIFQDLALEREVPREEILQLREAIVQLRRENPTEPGFAEVIGQLDSMLARAPTQITDENSPAFQKEFPELTRHIKNKKPGFTLSPLEAARSPGPAQEIEAARKQRAQATRAGNEERVRKLTGTSTVRATPGGHIGRVKKPPPALPKQMPAGDELRVTELADRLAAKELIDKILKDNNNKSFSASEAGDVAETYVRGKRIDGEAWSEARENRFLDMVNDAYGELVLGDEVEQAKLSKINKRSAQRKKQRALKRTEKEQAQEAIRATEDSLTPADEARMAREARDALVRRNELKDADKNKRDKVAAEQIVKQELTRRNPSQEHATDVAKAFVKERKSAGEGWSVERELRFLNKVKNEYNDNAPQSERDSDAVQERSPAKEAVRDEPRASKEDGSRDAPRREAPRESPKPASDEAVQKPEIRFAELEKKVGLEEVRGTDVDRRRVDQVFEAGKTWPDYPNLFSFLQAVRGMLGRQKGVAINEGKAPIHTTMAWAKIGGKPINIYELRAVMKRLDALGVDKDNVDGTSVEKPAPTKADTESTARRFGEDMAAYFREYKDISIKRNREILDGYIQRHEKEISTWLLSEDAKVKAGLRKIIELLRPDLTTKKPTIQPAVVSITGKLKIPDYKEATRVRKHDGDKVAKYRAMTAGRLDLMQATVDAINNGKPNVLTMRAAVGTLDEVISMWPKISSDTEALVSLKSLSAQMQTMLLEKFGVRYKGDDSTQAATTDSTGSTNNAHHTVRSVEAVVNKVQKNINPKMRYRNTFVVQNAQELIDNAEKMMVTDLGGRIVSLADIGAMIDEQGDYKTWIKSVFLEANAVNIMHYSTLIVVVDNVVGSKENLNKVLAHEYVAHVGLAVLFPDDNAHGRFLHRVGAIPGMERKRQQLLFNKPWYRHLSYLGQIEELVAFHEMEGPGTIEKLLSVPEGIDPETRRTLWEDFKLLVAEWLEKVFGIVGRSEVDKTLDVIVAALREHAIVGTQVDLNARLDALNVPSFASVFEATYGIALKDFIRPAIASSAVADTTTLLFGTGANSGRPYTPKPPGQHLRETLESADTLVNKAKEALSTIGGTAAIEVWKKASRNIEPMNNMALRSVLVEKTMRIMRNTIKVARRILTKRQETRHYFTDAAVFAPVRRALGNPSPGSNKAEHAAYGKIAIVATNNKLPQASEKVVAAAPRLGTELPDGTYRVIRDANGENAVFEQLLILGTVPKAEFEAGVPQYTVSDSGEPTQVSVAKLPQAIIDMAYDKIYVPESRHMAESKLEEFEHALDMLAQRKAAAVPEIIRVNNVAPTSQAFVSEVLSRMHKLYSNIAFKDYSTISRERRAHQQDTARQVLAELMRTMHEKLKVKDWTDSTVTRPADSKNPRTNDAFKWREQTNPHTKETDKRAWDKDVLPFVAQIRWFLEEEPGTNTSRLEHLYNLNVVGRDPQRQIDMLNEFQNILNAEVDVRQHENSVIQSILGNYVEFTRKGSNRVYIEVKDERGNPANISAELRAVLPVTYTESLREAKQLQADLSEELEGEHKMLDVDGNEITVTFDVGRGDAPSVSTLAETPDIREWVRISEIVGGTLNADIMKRVGNLIAHAAERKRLSLQRANVPGPDAAILRNNNETMTKRAWRAAKLSQAWMLDSVFADTKNVFGDWDRLKQLQTAFDIANRGAPEGIAPPTSFVRNEHTVYLAEARLLRYANQLSYMSKHTLSRPTVNIRTTNGEQKLKIRPEGEAHRAHAVAMRESLVRNTLEVNLNDIVSKTGPLRMASVVMGLGSVAAGIMNPFTLITHLPFVLGARHEKSGYGEGFNYSDIVSEIISSFSQVFTRFDMEDSAKLKTLLDAARAGTPTSGLATDELEFLYATTLEGLLMPQQTYSLTGGTESNISSLVLRNIAQALMRLFSGTEAGTRRVTALVMYRLAKKRYIAAGVDPAKFSDMASTEFAELMQDIERVVNNSQGDHTNINRPKVLRGDLSQYVFQFKMFPLMTVMMMNNLPKKEQALFLGVLFLLAGLKGEPFADDFMDIYDTLLQKLGFTHDSVELQLVQALEEIAPGSSKWVMHGFIDSLTFGGTMSSRLAMGDILPLTGIGRAGADAGREISNAFGPAYASNTATLDWAWTLTSYVAESIGLRSQITSWEELIRKMPQAQLRGLGEAALMARDGEITDPRGRLVSDEVTMYNIFSRALGFYPLEASRANDAVRLDRMHIGYMRTIRARYILAYANAYRANNQDRMDSILEAVQEWNEAAELTGQDDMLIRNFRSAARRAGRAASQTTIERTSSSAPDYSLIDELAEIVNADTESED